MITNILLIENNQNILEQLKLFLDELAVETYIISPSYSHALEIINSENLDLIICNPLVIENEELISFLKKKLNLSIPVLWLMSESDTANTKILLKHNPN